MRRRVNRPVHSGDYPVSKPSRNADPLAITDANDNCADLLDASDDGSSAGAQRHRAEDRDPRDTWCASERDRQGYYFQRTDWNATTRARGANQGGNKR
jgi:hypothetical protein